jgi:hypothetical protein
MTGSSGYREALSKLQRALSAVNGLRERCAELEVRLNELTLETADLLDSDEVERESALVTTSGVIEAKLSRAREKLFQAEGTQSAQLEGVRGEFSRLHLIYKLWRVSQEKERLSVQMVTGCPNISLEQVCLHLKTIAGLRELEMTAGEPGGLILQAERLLEAIQREPEFVVPPASGNASESVAVTREPVAERLYGPHLFRGMDEREIQSELSRIRTANPGLDLAGATRRLAEAHPELFSTEAEVAAMNAPLDALKSGVYEEQKSGSYKLYVQPIGSTTVE